MTPPTDPVQAVFVLVVLVAVAVVIVKVAAFAFGLYLAAVGMLYAAGHRIASTLVLILGGMTLGALGVATYHGVLSLLGWLL